MNSEPTGYECLDQLITSLRRDGRSADAATLHALLHESAWTTSSEMLGQLGEALRSIERDAASDASAPSLSPETKLHLDHCFELVQRAWPDFRR